MKSNTSSQNLWLTWTLTLTTGWLLIQYAGIQQRNSSFHTWAEVFPVFWQFALNGLLIGAFLGVVCGLAFRLWTNHAWLWGVTTFLGYALGSPLGFLTAIGLSWTLARLNGIELLVGSSNFLIMPLVFTMLFSGGLLALSQSFALQKTLPNLPWQARALWIFGSVLSWGVGFFLSQVAWGSGFPAFLQSAVVGLVVSGAMAGILQILLMGNRQPTKA
ncbi:MAG TPA: hypothetical protein PK530_08445 [Anaerolineales bacterium]|nr:hypothetical protein [Anaerolineales bacterium]